MQTRLPDVVHDTPFDKISVASISESVNLHLLLYSSIVQFRVDLFASQKNEFIS